jgi:hypothetical protein
LYTYFICEYIYIYICIHYSTYEYPRRHLLYIQFIYFYDYFHPVVDQLKVALWGAENCEDPGVTRCIYFGTNWESVGLKGHSYYREREEARKLVRLANNRKPVPSAALISPGVMDPAIFSDAIEVHSENVYVIVDRSEIVHDIFKELVCRDLGAILMLLYDPNDFAEALNKASILNIHNITNSSKKKINKRRSDSGFLAFDAVEREREIRKNKDKRKSGNKGKSLPTLLSSPDVVLRAKKEDPSTETHSNPIIKRRNDRFTFVFLVNYDLLVDDFQKIAPAINHALDENVTMVLYANEYSIVEEGELKRSLQISHVISEVCDEDECRRILCKIEGVDYFPHKSTSTI